MQPGSLMSCGLMSDTQKLSRPSLRGTLHIYCKGGKLLELPLHGKPCVSLTHTIMTLQGDSAGVEDGHSRLAAGTEQTLGFCLSK